MSRFKQALEKLKQKPAQHLTSFLILHELSAIIPLPLIYYTLKHFDLKFDLKTNFGKELQQQAELKVERVTRYFGLDLNGKEVLWMVGSYVIVKLMMPVRIGASLYLTPLGARIIDTLRFK